MHIRAIGAAAIAAALIGCSRFHDDSALIDAVPAGSRTIVDVNLAGLLKMAGCDSEHGIITLTTDARALLSSYPEACALVEAAASQGNWIDLEHAVIYKQSDASPVILAAERKDEKEAPQALRLYKPEAKEYDDLEVATITDGASIVCKDKRVWIACASADNLLAELGSTIFDKKKRSAAVLSPDMRQFFQSESSLKALARVGVVDNPWGEKFDAVLINLNVSDRLITCRARCALDGSIVDPISSLQQVDTIAFADMPIGTVATMAAGIKSDALKQLPQLVSALPMQSQLALNLVAELLGENGGTAAVAIAPGGSAETIRTFNLNNWVVRVMLPTADKGEAAAEIVNHVAPENVYAEADDDYLRIWNYDPFDEEGLYYRYGGIETPVQEGDKAVAFVNIPYRSQTMKALGLNRGYDIQIALADSSATLTARMLGPSNYILPAVVQDLARKTRN